VGEEDPLETRLVQPPGDDETRLNRNRLKPMRRNESGMGETLAMVRLFQRRRIFLRVMGSSVIRTPELRRTRPLAIAGAAGAAAGSPNRLLGPNGPSGVARA